MQKKQIEAFIEKLTEGSETSRKDWYVILSQNPQFICKEFVELISNLKYNSQIYQVKFGIRDGLSLEQIKVYAKPEFSVEAMQDISYSIKHGLDFRKIKLYAKKEYENYIRQLNLISKKLNIEVLRKYLEMDLTVYDKVKRLVFISEHPNITSERIDIICSSEFKDAWDSDVHTVAFRKILDEELSIDELKIILNPNFNMLQIDEVALGFKHGLTEEQVRLYADEKFNFNRIHYFRLGLENNLPQNEIDFYINIDRDSMIEGFYKCFINGLTMEEVKFIEYHTRYTYSSQDIEIYISVLKKGMTISDLQEIMDSQTLILCDIEEIISELESGLSAETIKFYWKKGLNHHQMKEVRFGFESGLNSSQIELYAQNDFSKDKMSAILNCFISGMSSKEIEKMIKSNKTPQEIEKVRHNFESQIKDTALYELFCTKLLN